MSISIIDEELVADFVTRLLRHSALNSKAKRMGLVIRASPAGLAVWRIHEEEETDLEWE